MKPTPIRMLSVQQAIRRGLLIVNGPVLVLLLGPLGLFALLVSQGVVSRRYGWVGALLLVVGFVLAWLWWSISIARWRVWACLRVDDVPALKERAVAVGLTWPDGHVLEKTEIKSQRLAAQQRELDSVRPPTSDA